MVPDIVQEQHDDGQQDESPTVERGRYEDIIPERGDRSGEAENHHGHLDEDDRRTATERLPWGKGGGLGG
jgi:hypothetical protein